MSALRVGLVGAGPWAEKAYAPMLAAGPETALACVWARRADAAAALAAAHGAEASPSFDALLERCEAVAFAVPPDVQAALGVRAARAGRHLLLDKPLALDVPAAQALVRAVDEAGVVTQLMLTHRFRAITDEFLAAAHATRPRAARLAFVSGAFVSGPYATPWRREHGALHDLGPHAFDLLEAALGPIEDLQGHGDPRGWVALALRHAGGAVSDALMTGAAIVPRTTFEFVVHGDEGSAAFDGVTAGAFDAFAPARAAFAAAVRDGRSGPHDAHRGLALQRVIERALRAIA